MTIDKLLRFWDKELHPPFWHRNSVEDEAGFIEVDTFHISGMPNQRLDIKPRLDNDQFYRLMLDAYKSYVQQNTELTITPVNENMRQTMTWKSIYRIGNVVSFSWEVDTDKNYVEIKIYAHKGEPLQRKITELTKRFILELNLRQESAPKKYGY